MRIFFLVQKNKLRLKSTTLYSWMRQLKSTLLYGLKQEISSPQTLSPQKQIIRDSSNDHP